ncbi:hypothetical protein BpHYR1_035734 [Brachionus plicatilis]|uniref:Uncharacterized protein n=1 Tax=Brachionus plicatilis TaxID=10195 RepID=A0A3M7SYU0_BRAPC|nr:hypothetical protein BpHYR1_035734 [Brachionus plicatilis]
MNIFIFIIRLNIKPLQGFKPQEKNNISKVSHYLIWKTVSVDTNNISLNFKPLAFSPLVDNPSPDRRVRGLSL